MKDVWFSLKLTGSIDAESEQAVKESLEDFFEPDAERPYFTFSDTGVRVGEVEVEIHSASPILAN